MYIPFFLVRWVCCGERFRKRRRCTQACAIQIRKWWVEKKLTNKTNERAANGENRLVWNESNDYDDQKTGKAPLLLEWPRSVKKKLGSRAK